MLDFLADFGVDGHTISPGYEYDAAKNDMVKRLNLQPDDFFLTREGTREKFKDLPEWSERYSIARHADLPRVPRGQARAGMLRLGHPHAQHRRLAGAVLFHGRRGAFPDLQGHARPGRLEQVRRGTRHRQGQGPPLRELHDPVRLRAERRAQQPLERLLEEPRVQLPAPRPKPTGAARRSTRTTASPPGGATSPASRSKRFGAAARGCRRRRRRNLQSLSAPRSPNGPRVADFSEQTMKNCCFSFWFPARRRPSSAFPFLFPRSRMPKIIRLPKSAAAGWPSTGPAPRWTTTNCRSPSGGHRKTSSACNRPKAIGWAN